MPTAVDAARSSVFDRTLLEAEGLPAETKNPMQGPKVTMDPEPDVHEPMNARNCHGTVNAVLGRH